MNDLQIFKNTDFGEVRTIKEKGNVLFCGSDVAKALGYADTTQAIRKNCDKDGVSARRVIDSMGRTQQSNFITEGNLYRLIVNSKLPSAKKFERWVFDEVLPTIRKTGTYTSDYQKVMMQTRVENTKIRKAQILSRLSEQYDGTFKQVLQSYVTKELTGEHLIPLPVIGRKTYTATELGEMLGVTANRIGILANRNELKTDTYGQYFNDKAKGHNKEVSSFRYYENAIPIFKELISKLA